MKNSKLRNTIQFLMCSFFIFCCAKRTGSQSSYYAWFYDEFASLKITDRAFAFYKELFTNETIAKEAMKEFNVTTHEELMQHLTRSYAKGDPILHTTTAFCPNYQACSSYRNRTAVRKNMKVKDDVLVIGFLLTPRTLGARNFLRDSQLGVWNQNDTEKFSNFTCCDKLVEFSNMEARNMPDVFTPTNGVGSRAHVTVALAKRVSAVQTGFDLMDIVRCEEKCKAIKNYYLLQVNGDVAWVRYYGHGLFMLYTDAINYPTTFDTEKA